MPSKPLRLSAAWRYLVGMLRRKRPVALFSAAAALALLSACERPTHDPVKLKAVKAEARMLMNGRSPVATVLRPQWPAAIASLKPEFVSIGANGVSITTRPYFDGGWGYFVPRREGAFPEPHGRFEEAGEGVYWWHPY